MREAFLYPDYSVDRLIEISGKKAAVHLAWFKGILDPFLDAFFDEKIKAAASVDPEVIVLVEELHRFIRAGGKRIRPAFAYAAYVACGGRSLDSILYASAALEVLHAFALIHDDIIDSASLRRGSPSVHKVFEDFHQKRGFAARPEDFGVATAILVGDLAFAYADELLNTAPFPAERIRRTKEYFDAMKRQVVMGQYLDILAPLKKKTTEPDVLKILEYKTAKYTIERPLHIGASLAGAEEDAFQVFSSYAVPLGQAFQIRDDILGVFGSERQTGKPADSDIKEGKRTLLVVKAYEFGDKKDHMVLDRIVGNKNASTVDIEAVREIIRRVGALTYSQKMVINLTNQAKQAIYKAKLITEGKDYLIQAADYLLGRLSVP